MFHANISPSNVRASTLKSLLASPPPNNRKSSSNDGNDVFFAREYHATNFFPHVYALIPNG